jgi:hypothetical protein
MCKSLNEPIVMEEIVGQTDAPEIVGLRFHEKIAERESEGDAEEHTDCGSGGRDNSADALTTGSFQFHKKWIVAGGLELRPIGFFHSYRLRKPQSSESNKVENTLNCSTIF